MSDKYILDTDGRTPKPEPDLMKWARWFETAERTVAKTQVGKLKVSTVFLGLDYNFGYGCQPILFETMIFDGPELKDTGYQTRCSTWEQAEAMHEKAVESIGQ